MSSKVIETITTVLVCQRNQKLDSNGMITIVNFTINQRNTKLTLLKQSLVRELMAQEGFKAFVSDKF